jgi:hypothetical protein
MKYLLFSTFIFLQLHLLSQNFSITEQLHWGTTSLEYLRGVERTSDGGYLMFGQAKVQNNSITDTMYGYEDYFVMKLDNNKNLLWNKTYGGSGSDQAISLLKLLNGNYILIGSSRSSISGTKTAVNYGEFDTWVVCINENGEQLWDKSYGTLDNESFGFAINIDQNKIELLINSRGDVSGNKTVPSKGDVDGWLVEIDTLGTILNQHVYGGADEDYFNIIKPLNNGNYMLDCSSRSGVSGDKNSNSFGSSDTWLLEVDTNFAIVNQFAFGGVGDDQILLIEETANYYLFGGSSSSIVSGNKTSPKRCVYADATFCLGAVYLFLHRNADRNSHVHHRQPFSGVIRWHRSSSKTCARNLGPLPPCNRPALRLKMASFSCCLALRAAAKPPPCA